MLLAFSSNATSDTVTLTNFCVGLCSNSLVGKLLSDLYYDSSSNFQSNNWQKVQYNTDLFKWKLFIQKMTVLKKGESIKLFSTKMLDQVSGEYFWVELI